MNKKTALLFILFLPLFLSGCSTSSNGLIINEKTGDVVVSKSGNNSATRTAYKIEQALDKAYEGAPVTVVCMMNVVKVSFPADELFPTATTHVSSDNPTYLDRLVPLLTRYLQTDVEIEVFTDNSGSAEKSEALAQAQGYSVADDLMDKGIAPSRLQVKAYGLQFPIATNDTPEGRAANRRVVVSIIL